jgi:1-deoxy-D-xylulose-5-phosphate synthase
VRILDRIDQPADLKLLFEAELQTLAAELRAQMVATISLNGGHLASSLGAVELCIALHRVFESPTDKIVWDVGHQSYAHKMLTGRRESFMSIRQEGGLSGFPDPSESVHDAFIGGHASNSISAALGMALGRDLLGETGHVVAVIGDASIMGGMAAEAVNHWGHLGTRMIVVLNDNGLAISPSVGYLKRALVRALVLGAKEFGFSYVGPVDGHDIRKLEGALRKVRDSQTRPTFIHVITKKGKGYPPAEEDPLTFHGLPPSTAISRGPSYSEVLGQTVLRLMREDPRVVAITAAMSDGTGLALARQEFPLRVFDVGIAEEHAVTLAAGLAARGMRPIVAIYSTFLQRAYDQIIHDVCMQHLPVVFAIDRAGIVGEDGQTHQGTLDLSYLSCIPGLTVAAPKDENELQHLIYTGVRGSGPLAIRYPRGAGPGAELNPNLREIPIGTGEVLREGLDVAILALGTMVYPSLGAAKLLSLRGIECAVINARFAKPLDIDLILETTQRVKVVFTVEENSLAGGFGSAVLQLLQGQNGRVRCLGLPDEFVKHAHPAYLRAVYGLDAPGIAGAVMGFFVRA